MSVVLGEATAYLVLDTDNFRSSIVGAQSALQDFDSNSSMSLQRLGMTIENLGHSLTTYLTQPLADFAKSATQEVIDYEKAVTGIRKTVDDAEVAEAYGYAAQNASSAYAQLSDQIEDLAISTGMSAEELARVGEVAGQLGISVGEDGKTILRFIEIMAKLGVTTDLTAENAALSLARFLNVTGVAQDDVDRIGAAIVDLGNNFATQEPEIVNMATRLASAGTVAGLTAQEILALSTAISSVGIKTEAGASSMSQFITTMTKTVEIAGTEADEKGQWAARLAEAAHVAGMSAEEFQQRWRTKPIEAIQLFLNGLKNVDEEGENAILILDDLGLNSIRVGNMTRALALSSDLLADAVSTSNEAFEENIALDVEFNKFASTNAQAIARLREEWNALKRDFGDLIIPILQKLMAIAKQFIEILRALPPEGKAIVLLIGAIVAAIGPLLVGIGKVITAISVIKSFASGGGGMLTNLLGGCHKLGECAEGTAKNITGVGTSIGAIAKKALGITSIIAGIWMAVTSFFDMWNEGFSWAKELVMALGVALVAIGAVLLGLVSGPIAALVAAIVAVIATIAIVIHDHWDEIKAWWTNTAVPAIKRAAEAVGNFIKGALQALFDFSTLGFRLTWKALQVLINEILPWIGDFLSKVWNNISDWAAHLFENMGAWIKKAVNVIGAFFHNINESLNGFFDKVGQKLLDAKDFIATKIRAIGDAIQVALEFIFGNAWEKIKELGRTLMDTIKSVISAVESIFNTMKDIFGEILSSLGQAIMNLIELIKTGVQNVLKGMQEIFQTTIGAVVDLLTKIVKTIGEAFVKAIEFLEEKIKSIWETVKSLPEKFFEFGKNILTRMWDGLKSVWEGLKNWFDEHFGWLIDLVEGLIDKIKSIGDSKVVQAAKSWINGSHESGLEYVPFDGYIAELHQGERVLTREENQHYSDGDSGSGAGDVYNFYNVQSDPYEIARQVRRTKKELAFA